MSLFPPMVPPMVPAATSDTAPYTIWVAEANSGTALSKITFDPGNSNNNTIAPVNVLPGVHAGGITSWLSDPALPQYALYLWHDSRIEILNPATAAVGAPISIPVSGSGPILDFAISNDGTIGVAVARNDTHLYVVNLIQPGAISAVIDLGPSAHPRASAITDNNSTIYVTDSANGTVYTTDLSGKMVGTIHVSSSPDELGKPAILPGSSVVWIPDVTQNSVFRISSGNSTKLPISGLLDPREIQFNPNGLAALILSSPPAGFGSGRLSFVDTDTFETQSTISLGNQPSGLVLTSNSTIQFVANSGDGNVAVVNHSVTNFNVGSMPVGVVAVH